MTNQTHTSILLFVISLFFATCAFAQEERTNHYTQVIVYFAFESLMSELEPAQYMKEHTYAQAYIKRIMEGTDTTMNLHQRGFGPFPLEDDPARDSIMAAEGQTGKITNSARAWSAMNTLIKNDPSHPVSQKVQEIKEMTGAEVITIVIIGYKDHYAHYGQSNIPIYVLNHNSDESNHLEVHNKIIFDETSTKAVGFGSTYPQNHPQEGKTYRTIFGFNPNILIYPRLGFYKDRYGFWLQVGDEDHNVLDPENGWKLHYLYNKGLLQY